MGEYEQKICALEKEPYQHPYSHFTNPGECCRRGCGYGQPATKLAAKNKTVVKMVKPTDISRHWAKKQVDTGWKRTGPLV
jgi:hypothetical protein